jgi:hypothetical protein
MFAAAIRRYRPDCEVVPWPSSIATHEAILAASEADVLFSCVDTAEGRHIADRLSAYFAMPLFDVGVAIPTEAAPAGGRRVAEVYGRVDYVYPGGSSLRIAAFTMPRCWRRNTSRAPHRMRWRTRSPTDICGAWRTKRPERSR